MPSVAYERWHENRIAAVPSTGIWRVVEAPLYPSIDALLAIRPTGNLGPVLASPDNRLAWWLVASGTATILDTLPDVVVHPAGWVLDCPAPGTGAEGRTWLHPPYGTGLLTPARLLREALLDARVMEAMER
nr:hypothetical protein [Streptomyces sp. TverLS-915]